MFAVGSRKTFDRHEDVSSLALAAEVRGVKRSQKTRLKLATSID